MARDGCCGSVDFQSTATNDTPGNGSSLEPGNAGGSPRSGRSYAYPLALFAGIILLMLLAAI